jgi:signal transduction histidine kinase
VTRSLKGKMILSYLLVALLTVLVVSVLIRLTSSRSLLSLVVEEQIASLKESVQTYYSSYGSLDGFFEDYSLQYHRVQQPPPQNNGPDGTPISHTVRGVTGLIDTSYRALIPTMGYGVGEVVPEEKVGKKIAVEVDGQMVAWIIPDTSQQVKLSPEEQLFLQRTTLAIALAAVAGVIAAVGIGFFLASGLLRPIRQLTRVAQSMAHGQLNQQVPVTSRDELGLLTATFNQMSADLDHADQQRKRLTADITHDLGTPLQIISGYIEMLEEGEVSLTPQRIQIIRTELENLRRLVGDLSTLTQVEAGGLDIQREAIQPAGLLEHVYDAFDPIAARNGVRLVLDVPEVSPTIQVDEGRMVQVLKNLLENALRYTPKDGEIRLGLAVDEQVRLSVTDSGVGIDPEDLPYVFDRFYQGDKARSANVGKMGLGLAICKALVAAQGGTIAAQSQGKGHGTSIVISFPAG